VTVYLGTAKKRETIKNTKTKKERETFEFSKVFYILLSTVIVLGISYGLVANKSAITGYNIKVMEKKLNNTKDKNDELRISISELKSVNILENKSVEMGMIEPENVEYMSIGNSFALK
jgi:cell division protein FtsL